MNFVFIVLSVNAIYKKQVFCFCLLNLVDLCIVIYRLAYHTKAIIMHSIHSCVDVVVQMSSSLLTTPFQSMNATQKAAILVFLCNELLCAKNINAYVA